MSADITLTDTEVEVQGDLALTDGASIRFANGTDPMVYIFTSGTSNPDRPVLAHSPRFPTWGLLYRDDGDKMIFQRAGGPVLTADLGMNRVGVGTDSPQHTLHVNGSAAGTQGFRTLSDGRCKTDVETLEGALEAVQALRGVRFRWEEEACSGLDVADGPQVGLVAQEVLEVVPEAVRQGEDGRYTLDAGALVPVLVEAVKALQAQVEAQAVRLRRLEGPPAPVSH